MTTGWPDADTPVSEVVDRYGLEPLAVEGGFWAPLRRTEAGNAILYLMTPDGFSALHLLTVAEGWTWLAGAPARMLQLDADGSELVLDARTPAQLVPPGTWQGTSTTGDWTLVMCWCVPAFTDDCFSLGDGAALAARHPGWADRIRELSR